MTTAMILAAGRGQRMRPLTDTTPKPLLKGGGKALIEWQIERLVKAGFGPIVINHAWLGTQFEPTLGDGSRYSTRLMYSQDTPDGTALETLGGIVKALPLIGHEPFVVVSGDIYTTYDYAQLHAVCADITQRPHERAAHLVLTNNPDFHPQGDMPLINGLIHPPGNATHARLTYGNICVFHPRLFVGCTAGVAQALFPWAYQWAAQGLVSGEHFTGVWENVGTPEQLAQLDARLSASAKALP